MQYKKHKKKFKPVITKVKLNPEQAVLSCCSTSYGRVTNGTQNCGWFATCYNDTLVTSGASS